MRKLPLIFALILRKTRTGWSVTVRISFYR